MQKALIIAFFLFCFPALSALPPGTYFFTQESVGGNSGSSGVHFSVYQLLKTNRVVRGIEGTIPALLRDVVILNDGTNVSIFGITLTSSNLVTIRQTGSIAFSTTTSNDTVRALTQVNNSIITVDEKNCILVSDIDGKHIATLANPYWLDPTTDGHIRQIQVLATTPKGHRNIVSKFALLTNTGKFIIADLSTLGQPSIIHLMQLPSSTPRVRFIASNDYAWFLQGGAQPWRYYYPTQSVTTFTARTARIGGIEKQIPLALDSYAPLLTMRWGQDLVTLDASANTVHAMDAGFFHPNRLTEMGVHGVSQQIADSMIILPPTGAHCSQYLLPQPAIQQLLSDTPKAKP